MPRSATDFQPNEVSLGVPAIVVISHSTPYSVDKLVARELGQSTRQGLRTEVVSHCASRNQHQGESTIPCEHGYTVWIKPSKSISLSIAQQAEHGCDEGFQNTHETLFSASKDAQEVPPIESSQFDSVVSKGFSRLARQRGELRP